MSHRPTRPIAAQIACLARYLTPTLNALARAETTENTITIPSARSAATQHNRMPVVRLMPYPNLSTTSDATAPSAAIIQSRTVIFCSGQRRVVWK